MYLKKDKPATSHLAARKGTESFASTKKEAVKPQLLYKDVRLQHLNPGYSNKDAYEFMKLYKAKEELVLDTFKYNNETNEENFVIECATAIQTAWLQGDKNATGLFKQFNKQRNSRLSMYICERN